jgi:hypothetical protein
VLRISAFVLIGLTEPFGLLALEESEVRIGYSRTLVDSLEALGIVAIIAKSQISV